MIRLGEWPQPASQALDYLLAELADARKERSRFDNFIRSNAFVDKMTGIGNRLFSTTGWRAPSWRRA